MATEDARKLFVAGLSESITEDVLRQLFEATGGKVVEVSLPRERATGKVRGFGFVTLATSDEANKARGLLDGSFQAGRSISVRPFMSEAPKRGDRPEGAGRSEAPPAAGPAEDRTLYVGNLPYDTSQQELAEFLSANGVGPVARMSLPTGPDGRMRGYGFLTLATAEAAQSALAILQRTDLKGRRLMVNVAHPRTDRAPGPGGGPPSYSRPPPRMGGGMGMGGEPRYPTEPPMGIEAPSEDRRSRNPGPPEGGDERAAAGKKKKGARGGGGPAQPSRTTEERRRGGGSNWQSRVDWDDDD